MHHGHRDLLGCGGGGDEFGAHAISRLHPPVRQAAEKRQNDCWKRIRQSARPLSPARRRRRNVRTPRRFGRTLRLRDLRIHVRVPFFASETIALIPLSRVLSTYSAKSSW